MVKRLQIEDLALGKCPHCSEFVTFIPTKKKMFLFVMLVKIKLDNTKMVEFIGTNTMMPRCLRFSIYNSIIRISFSRIPS
jgi:hypothetical protein